MTRLRWAQPQSLRAPWHVVVEDLPPSDWFLWGRQRAACGVLFVQQDEWLDMGSRDWLVDYACPRCAKLYPIPREGGGPEWQERGVRPPLFPVAPTRA